MLSAVPFDSASGPQRPLQSRQGDDSGDNGEGPGGPNAANQQGNGSRAASPLTAGGGGLDQLDALQQAHPQDSLLDYADQAILQPTLPYTLLPGASCGCGLVPGNHPVYYPMAPVDPEEALYHRPHPPHISFAAASLMQQQQHRASI